MMWDQTFLWISGWTFIRRYSVRELPMVWVSIDATVGGGRVGAKLVWHKFSMRGPDASVAWDNMGTRILCLTAMHS